MVVQAAHTRSVVGSNPTLAPRIPSVFSAIIHPDGEGLDTEGSMSLLSTTVVRASATGGKDARGSNLRFVEDAGPHKAVVKLVVLSESGGSHRSERWTGPRNHRPERCSRLLSRHRFK